MRGFESDPLPYWPDLAADWLQRARRPTHNLLPTRNQRAASKQLRKATSTLADCMVCGCFYCVFVAPLQSLSKEMLMPCQPNTKTILAFIVSMTIIQKN